MGLCTCQYHYPRDARLGRSRIARPQRQTQCAASRLADPPLHHCTTACCAHSAHVTTCVYVCSIQCAERLRCHCSAPHVRGRLVMGHTACLHKRPDVPAPAHTTSPRTHTQLLIHAHARFARLGDAAQPWRAHQSPRQPASHKHIAPPRLLRSHHTAHAHTQHVKHGLPSDQRVIAGLLAARRNFSVGRLLPLLCECLFSLGLTTSGYSPKFCSPHPALTTFAPHTAGAAG